MLRDGASRLLSNEAGPERESLFRLCTCHGLAAEPGEPPPIADVPLSSHITACPLALLYQRMSVIPSPLKSPAPAMLHGLPAEPSEPPPITLVPLMSHTTAWPVSGLYQSTSPKP